MRGTGGRFKMNVFDEEMGPIEDFAESEKVDLLFLALLGFRLDEARAAVKLRRPSQSLN
jgi:hypothetical protein